MTVVSRWFVVCAFAFGMTGAGCGLKEYINCDDICSKKKECGTNSNYDVSNCKNSCSDQANQSTDYARLVDTCKECLGSLSCTDPKFAGCLSNCPSLPN